MGHRQGLASYRLVSLPYLPQMAHDEQTTDGETMNLDWQENAACSGTDTETFFPEYNRDTDNQKEEILDALSALRICSACTVSAQCLAYAMAEESSVSAGIYGGTLAYERQRVIRAQGRAVIGGGAPRLEHSIRRHATKAGIPAPTLGVGLSKVKDGRASRYSVSE